VRRIALGPNDPSHLASGRIRFEDLTFEFHAPYQTWIKAKRRGIEARICRLIMSRCAPGGVAIDVGANCGFLSIIMALSVGAAGRVLSFEREPVYHSLVNRNIAVNKLDKIVTPILTEVSAEGETLDAAATRFDLKRLDFLKIDVDGGDYDVLRGARKLLDRFHPVVVVEMTRNQDQILSYLREDLGYQTLAGMSGEPVVGAPWPPNLIACNGPIHIPPPGQFARRA